MADTQVLICGAGPTGLVLALWLNRLGVRVRLIDRAAEPGTASRALGVQARTLELYAQIGLDEAAIAAGLEFTAVNLWVEGQKKARAAFGDMGQGLSPYPYMLILPQDEHERLLIGRLAEAGVSVERPTELLSFEEHGTKIVARLKHADGTEETCEADYLAGCDGARSTVRKGLAMEFMGGTYEQRFYVADIEGSGPMIDGELHVAVDEADFLAVFPLKGPGRARLIGVVPRDGDSALTFEDVNPSILERLRLTIDKVNWFSTYNVHHRVAAHFRKGRTFLLGDAAHLHSPAGAQGMNTGLGDAVNLAWKLAAVLQGRAVPTLLDTYEPERIAFAQQLVATTDRVFNAATSSGPLATVIRTELLPRIAPFLGRARAVQRFMFRTISQTRVHYCESALSEGHAGAVQAGKRLPWIAEADNFKPLRSVDWQVHVYGEAAPELHRACAARRLPLHVFPWSAAAQRTGFERDALLLVRPDGYVALADPEADPARLERYLDAWGIRPAGSASAAASDAA